MSIRAISRQHCDTCGGDTQHLYCVCQVCKTIKPSATEVRHIASRRIRNKGVFRFGGVGYDNLVAANRAQNMALARQDKIARGVIEPAIGSKRPRSINSERRPSRADEGKS